MILIMNMTWKEMLRKRVMILAGILSILFLIAYWFIGAAIADSNRSSGFMTGSNLITDYASGVLMMMIGFFFAGFVVALLSIFSSFSSIAGEAEQGVMQALLPRPIPRWKFYIGRWLGYVSLLLCYTLVLYTAIMIITDIHAAIPQDPMVHIQAFLLYALVIVLLISLTMLGSTRFSSLGNGVFMTMLFGAGWLGGMLEKIRSIGIIDIMDAEVAVKLSNISGLMSMLMPVDALQRKMLHGLIGMDELGGLVDISGMVAEFFVGNPPSGTFVVYALIYTAIVFVWGILRFQRKDL
ncbi:ABC transporter permease subunit [Paenibacillus urinalis]|uniref:ABC transporter permease subunit n=1 Tax=Paenibacillus urinalis TaxID=521520 RepID=A0AAX3N2W4_9BACL|nr:MULTISPECIES: ABC transporter permease subunit [Paenibacillus]WDH83648.1 ABC transporter permease subunit [Paenibacillus urinalis]WDH99676.1 ABC transporter permease subunit [Paenibacillus urinalis]WDI03309.1 ABC transporter permease subunit [Paenibacillus urinalis]GAK42417.1 ABC transporter permease protein [Paenibacillus sp. TCA20]